jgi:hypothetical protein
MLKMNKINWHNLTGIPSSNFVCGYCGHSIASALGFQTNPDSTTRIYICHFCTRPTYINPNDEDQFKQSPGVKFGENVNDISNLAVADLYDEARKCMSVNSHTAAVLCCRKLLMNIAVSKGAKEGLQFVKYVEFLSANHYVPPGSEEWVDHIRKKGNEATHEISIMEKESAEELISFIEMILKFTFEFPARMNKKKDSESYPPSIDAGAGQ